MGAFPLSLVLLCVFVTSCPLIGYAADDAIDPSWLKPGALDRWEQRQRSLKQPEESCNAKVQQTVDCNCPPAAAAAAGEFNDGITEDQKLAPTFYRKLVKTLFERDVLQLDPSGAFHSSFLSLKVSSRQLDKLLDEVVSIREIDTTLAEILEQSNNMRRKSVLQENRCERLYNFLLEFVESKLLLNALPVVLLLVACFVVRIIARFTRMHPFIVFLLFILSLSVLHKWKECNENLRENFLRSHPWSPAESKSLPICDPMEVLLEATVSMQAVYFNAMFKHFLNAFKEHTQNMGFVQRVLVGLLLLGFAYVLLTTMLQVGIASGFRMFGTVVSAGLQFPRHAVLTHNGDAVHAPPPTVNLNIQIGDGVAGAPPRTGLYRLEGQRIEIVSEEQSTPPITEKATAPPMVEEKRKAIEAKETERQKEDPKSSTSLVEEEGSDIEIIDG